MAKFGTGDFTPKTTRYAYNLAGALEQEQVAGGVFDAVIVDPAYDALLRRTTLNATGPGWGYQQSYAYDQAGRLGTIASGNQSISYGYVPNSNLLATSQSATGGANVLTTTRTWDNLNRLTAIANVATGLNQTFAYQYNDANQRTQVTREDGASWDYGYDALGQVTGAVQKQPGGTPVAARAFGYAYDAIGTRTSASFSGATGNTHTIGYTKAAGDGTQYASITHPGAAVVTGEADPAASVMVNGAAPQARQSSYFAHELTLNNANGPAAQAVEISATLGAATETEQRHAFVPAATAAMEYDLDGNLTFDGFLEYTWDAENRLITVRTRPGLAPAGSSMKDFRQVMVYDHAGRRIRRSTYYTIGGTEHRASDDLFVYDGWNQIAVLDAGTRLPRQTYVWGLDLSQSLQGAGGVGGLALITDIPSQTSHFVSYDGNGNVTGMADAATGQQTAEYVYDAFGNLLAAKGAFAMRNPWRFSTKVQDEGSGLYYYGFRYYDPTTGRWTSRDPAEEKGGENLYGFVANNVPNSLDFLGKWRIRRDSRRAWAEAESEAGDTLASLAERIHLDVAEISKWLRGGILQDFEEPVGEGCVYEIPNVVAKFTSRGFEVSQLLNNFRHAVESANAKALGYKVESRLRTSAFTDFTSLWQIDGIYQMLFAQHGYFETGIGYRGVRLGEMIIAPRNVRPPYKLAFVAALTCFSAEDVVGSVASVEVASWSDHVARNGGFIGYIGDVSLWNVNFPGRTVVTGWRGDVLRHIP